MTRLTTQCPSCGKGFQVAAGALGRCKRCDTLFRIREGRGEPVEAVSAGARETDRPDRGDTSGGADGASAAVWRPGDVILDLYEVTGVLGEGGMGTVYKVHHRGWNVDLAVKCPKPDYFRTDRQKENFAAECQMWINLGLHPHIVSCRIGRVPCETVTRSPEDGL